MAGVFNAQVSRNTSGSDALVPEPLATEIIQEMPKYSAALSMFRQVPLSSKTWRMPVLDVLPFAYWVNGDTGLKQTSNAAWKNVFLVVEELATIIPIPEAYLDDAQVPLWNEVRPRMAEAAGKVIDQAIFWGENKPGTWSSSVWEGIQESGNIVTDGYMDVGGGTTEPADDFGQTIAAVGDMMAQTGYTVNGFVGRPGLNWKLIGLRSAQGMPIYEPDMQNGRGGGLYGFPLNMVDNGSFDQSKAQLLAGDMSKAIVGMRQDMTFKLFTEGVISDDQGNVILNLMQQDAVALRLVVRLAYATANPVTVMQPTKSIDGADGTQMRWPFAAVATQL